MSLLTCCWHYLVLALLPDLRMCAAVFYIWSVYLAVLWGPFHWVTSAGCLGLLQVPAEERDSTISVSLSCLMVLSTVLSAACRCQCGSNLIR